MKNLISVIPAQAGIQTFGNKCLFNQYFDIFI